MGIALAMKALTEDIASSHEDRLRKLVEIKQGARQVREAARKLTNNFQTSRKDIGAQLRIDLAQEKADIKSEVGSVLKGAQDLVRGFETSRKEASSLLRKDLSEAKTNRRSKVAKALKDAEELLKGFHASRRSIGSELKKELAQSRQGTRAEVGELLMNAQGLRSDFRKVQAELRTELKKAAAVWQALGSTIRPKRAQEKVPAKGKKTELPDLETRLLALIEEHPNGIALPEAAHRLGAATIALGRVSRSLLDRGKIHKEDKLYFPAAS